MYRVLVYHIVRYFGEFWYFLRQQIIIMKARKKITTTFRRISLLLWKNILFRRKLLMILLTILEIVAPTLLVGGLAYYRTKVENDTGIKENNFTYFSTYPEEVRLNKQIIFMHWSDSQFYICLQNVMKNVWIRLKGSYSTGQKKAEHEKYPVWLLSRQPSDPRNDGIGEKENWHQSRYISLKFHVQYPETKHVYYCVDCDCWLLYCVQALPQKFCKFWRCNNALYTYIYP